MLDFISHWKAIMTFIFLALRTVIPGNYRPALFGEAHEAHDLHVHEAYARHTPPFWKSDYAFPFLWMAGWYGKRVAKQHGGTSETRFYCYLDILNGAGRSIGAQWKYENGDFTPTKQKRRK